MHQRWVADVGIPGLDAGQGGRRMETNLRYWQELHEVIDGEPPYDGFGGKGRRPGGSGAGRGRDRLLSDPDEADGLSALDLESYRAKNDRTRREAEWNGR